MLPFYLEELRDFSTGEAGLLLTPLPLTIAGVAPFSGRLSDRIGARRDCQPLIGHTTWRCSRNNQEGEEASLVSLNFTSPALQSNVYALFITEHATFMRRLRPIYYTFTRSSEYGSLIW